MPCVVIKNKTGSSAWNVTKKDSDKIPVLLAIITNSESSSNKYSPILLSDIVGESNITGKYVESVMKFIFAYASLYPEGHDEYPPPDKDFKHRSISTLLSIKEVPIFHKLINYTDDLHRDEQCREDIYIEDLYQLSILIEAGHYAELLCMKILLRKIGACLALYLKDKNVSYIHKLFMKI